MTIHGWKRRHNCQGMAKIPETHLMLGPKKAVRKYVIRGKLHSIGHRDSAELLPCLWSQKKSTNHGQGHGKDTRRERVEVHS